MRLLSRIRKEKKTQLPDAGTGNLPAPGQLFKVDYEKIDNYILEKYGLQDIQKKEWFMLLNILFLVTGVSTMVIFLYSGFTIASLVGAVICCGLGSAVFHMAKKYGVLRETRTRQLKNPLPIR